MRPQLEMTDQKVELLLRTALVEDASDVNERMAAIIADISVEDGEVEITLDTDLWPDAYTTVRTNEMARSLMLEVEFTGTEGSGPFAWAGLGEGTNNVTQYLKMVMDAYADRPIRGE